MAARARGRCPLLSLSGPHQLVRRLCASGKKHVPDPNCTKEIANASKKHLQAWGVFLSRKILDASYFNPRHLTRLSQWLTTNEDELISCFDQFLLV